MIEWFTNLSDTNKIAIVIPIAVVVIGGVFTLLFKCLPRKKDDPPKQTNITNVIVLGKVISPEKIKKILTECIEQENENG